MTFLSHNIPKFTSTSHAEHNWHRAPGGGVGETVRETELGLQEFVGAANDVGDDGLRGVEDAALDSQGFVVGVEEVLVEVDDGIVATGLVAEVAQDGGKVSFLTAQEFHHVLDAEFVEVDAALAPARMEEGLEHLLEEGIGDRHHVGDVAGDEGGAFAALGHFRAGDGRGEQAVSDGLGVGVGKSFLGEVVDEVELEGGVEFPQRSIVRLAVDQGLGGIADAFGQHRHGLGQHVGGIDDMADAMAEDAGPAGAPVIERFLGIRPVELFAQGGGEVVDLERGVAAVPAEHAEGGHVALLLMEVGEGDFATIVFRAEGGDEEQVLGVPGRAVGLVGRGAFLHHEVRKDAAKDDDGEFFLIELDEKDAPRLL